jgi:colanic acid/amylovoran biosynthesis glycosyltransferase
MYGAWLLDVSFSFTGHATDLFRDRCALEDKIRRAEFIVCISEFHRDFYLKHGARQDQLFIAYCGIDPEWFYPTTAGRSGRYSGHTA